MWLYYYHYCDNNQQHSHELVSTTNRIMHIEIRLIIYSAQQILRPSASLHRIRNVLPMDEITVRQSFTLDSGEETVQWLVQNVAIKYYILHYEFAEWNWKLLNLLAASKVWSVNAFNFNKLLISVGELCWNRTLWTLDGARSIVAELLYVGIVFYFWTGLIK